MKFPKMTFAIAGAVLAAVPLLAAQAQGAQSQPSADRLSQEMKADAQTIETHAAQLEKLAADSNTQWAQFDRLWNEIKPAQEALQMKIERLDQMRSSLTDQQRKMLDQTKPAAERIMARTHELFQQIDQPGNDLTSARFRVDARSLARNAQTVAKGA